MTRKKTAHNDSAIRASRSRERRARGDVWTKGDVTRSELDALVARGLLNVADLANPDAVFAAIKNSALRHALHVTDAPCNREDATCITIQFDPDHLRFINDIKRVKNYPRDWTVAKTIAEIIKGMGHYLEEERRHSGWLQRAASRVTAPFLGSDQERTAA